jgi:hypothetical protein
MRTSSQRDAFETALQGAFDFCCYYLGRAVILLGTLGRLKCDPLFAFMPRRKLRDCGLHHRRGGQLYMTREGTHVVGSLAGLVLVCSVGVFLYFHVGDERPFPSENPTPELHAPAAGDTK